MKISLAFVAVMFLGLSVSFGQSARNENITASAEILAPLTLSKDADINFGNVSATTPGPVFLDPTGQANAYVGTTAAVGRFTITGAIGVDNSGTTSPTVKVSWPASIELESGSDKMLYHVAVNGLGDATQSSAVRLGTLGTVGTADVVLTNEEGLGGTYYLYVGGNLGKSTDTAGTPTALANQATGTYTATLNFTVEYN